ncbi:MAG: FHA domain-containing protein, partial [Vicinamibacterales bacterium]
SAFELVDGGVVGIIPCQDDLIVTTIGRSHGSTIRLDDQFAHREHARIRWDSVINAHVLEDNGGLNGTFLDGKRVLYPRRLQDGARIRVGYTELIYRRRWSPSSLTEARTIVANLATPERMTMPLPSSDSDAA